MTKLLQNQNITITFMISKNKIISHFSQWSSKYNDFLWREISRCVSSWSSQRVKESYSPGKLVGTTIFRIEEIAYVLIIGIFFSTNKEWNNWKGKILNEMVSIRYIFVNKPYWYINKLFIFFILENLHHIFFKNLKVMLKRTREKYFVTLYSTR